MVGRGEWEFEEVIREKEWEERGVVIDGELPGRR